MTDKYILRPGKVTVNADQLRQELIRHLAWASLELIDPYAPDDDSEVPPVEAILDEEPQALRLFGVDTGHQEVLLFDAGAAENIHCILVRWQKAYRYDPTEFAPVQAVAVSFSDKTEYLDAAWHALRYRR